MVIEESERLCRPCGECPAIAREVRMDEGDYGPSEGANGWWLASRGCVPSDELSWMRLSRVHADVAKNSKSRKLRADNSR